MKPDYDAGDVVECVNVGQIQCLQHPQVIHIGHEGLKLGAVHRVSGFERTCDVVLQKTECTCPVAVMLGGTYGHFARFKKLEKADDAFILSLKVKKPEPVS